MATIPTPGTFNSAIWEIPHRNITIPNPGVPKSAPAQNEKLHFQNRDNGGFKSDRNTGSLKKFKVASVALSERRLTPTYTFAYASTRKALTHKLREDQVVCGWSPVVEVLS
jgi:hypothetical protein